MVGRNAGATTQLAGPGSRWSVRDATHETGGVCRVGLRGLAQPGLAREGSNRRRRGRGGRGLRDRLPPRPVWRLPAERLRRLLRRGRPFLGGGGGGATA